MVCVWYGSRFSCTDFVYRPPATGSAPVGSWSSTDSFCRDDVGFVTTTWQPYTV